ncbi:MAG: hypothetical protein H7A23_05405 [Leptospiraceae bacterium]|nr:hypothetical protein [Leptospiraceae bacterium]MCP5493973.1 hypothetical protein [Leptospiraceae bacterium]
MKKFLIGTIIGLMTAGSAFAWFWEDVFNVKNNSSRTIVQILARPTGSGSWGTFLNGETIEPGDDIDLKWSENASDQCLWQFKVSFEDGSESAAAEFDTCEDHDMVVDD